jgi:hypothetical protein
VSLHEPITLESGPGWRQAAARSEMTRDPIFLYQVRAFCRDEVRAVHWRTDSVWLSRGEAEAWGRRNQHNHPAGDWRVYCLCAEGALAKLLDAHAGEAK